MRLLSNLFLLGLATAVTLPPEFKKCKLSDKKRDECLIDAIQNALVFLRNGYSSLSFPALEPIKVERMTIGEGNSSVHLVQNYKNVEIYGLSTTKLSSVKSEHTDNTSTLSLKGIIDEVRLEADYNITGKILFFPIQGNGKCTMRLLNVLVAPVVIANHYIKNGVTYSKVQQFISSTSPEKLELKFENLFNGNEALSKQVHQVINDEWEVLFNDVKPAIEEALGAVFKRMTNIIYVKIPFHDLFPK